jgi:hypothetical protein
LPANRHANQHSLAQEIGARLIVRSSDARKHFHGRFIGFPG